MHHGEIEKSLASIIESSAKTVLQHLNIQPQVFRGIKAELEFPKEKAHGDLASNIALKCSKLASRPPLEIAAMFRDGIEKSVNTSPLKGAIGLIEVKKPGFINFFFSKEYLDGVLLEIEKAADNFGRSDIGAGAKLQIEFVSANPTGPLTIAHGRQAALGDSLAGIMESLGYDVTREYYLNDEGNQMNILGRSIRARYMNLCGLDEPFPEDGYKGSYVIDIAKDFEKIHGREYMQAPDIDEFREFGLKWILDDIKRDLADFGVKFDVWYSQKALRESGHTEEAVAFLKKNGYIYESEGAVWFKSTEFGDDKDRVIYKSDGSATYLTPDIAYHQEKFRRGFKKIIDIWGPDHHGYIPRLKAAVQALGHPEDSLSVLIVQLATLYRNGQPVSMSTRAGEFVTLREVMDEVGKDVARFCFISRRMSSHLDFDLDVVKKESSENPVFYIQYAHARIWSILEYGKDAEVAESFDPGLLKEPEEIEIMRLLRQFPMAVALSGRLLEPYVVLQYLQELASAFHSFYNKHRVVGDDSRLTKSRVVLVDCIRIVLANGLRLLGVSLPKKM
ncbi:MAG: arginine--tRNA ligase [Candidatus Omnitrophica bacterium]|nr:arginine--tRNA ligase [Candidatus Omnitrophota bacterium]